MAGDHGKSRMCRILFGRQTQSPVEVEIVTRKITNAKKGVSVKIEGKNAVKILKVIDKTHRTFASEVNVGVEQYADKQIHKYRDDGK